MTGSTRQNPAQQLNWIFYNPVNDLSRPYYVEIGTFEFNKPLQYLRELFAEQIKLEHKFSADIRSVKFWKPKEKLELLSLPTKWIQDNDMESVARFLPVAARFKAVFSQQLDSDSLHLLITAEPLPDDEPDPREDSRDTVMEVAPMHAFHKREYSSNYPPCVESRLCDRIL
ncbi:hypothetical protein IW262DRAFT_198832 [Armillaria fumosa]|nr:hypothetical protein IW262DRAFT_198832 [Armillaria fumosa]